MTWWILLVGFLGGLGPWATTITTSRMVILVDATTPITNLHVTLRGKKYVVEDPVTTVQEVQERIATLSGIDPTQQGRVLFDGKRLSPTDPLSEVGIESGATINMIPTTSSSSSSGSTSSSGASGGTTPTSSSGTGSTGAKKKKVKSASSSTSSSSTASSANTMDLQDESNKMKDLMAKAGIDTSKLDDLVKSMGGPNNPMGAAAAAAGNDGEVPNMQESMEMMASMMNSPLFQEFMNDPERLEQSRQMILQNPMLSGMMGSMPGMQELLHNKEAFREAMQAAASIYKNMDSNDLLQAMMGNLPSGMETMGNSGLFDGTATTGNTNSKAGTADTSALDELGEED